MVMLVVDLLWLGLIAKSFYRDGIGHLMADPPNLVAGGIFHLLYPVGVMFFAVGPAAWFGGFAAPAAVPFSQAVMAGAMFGFFAYAAYDLSNLVTLRDWPLAVGRWALGVGR